MRVARPLRRWEARCGLGSGACLGEAGRVLEVSDRNRSDVELSRDVYAFGRAFGYGVARQENGVGFEQREVEWR